MTYRNQYTLGNAVFYLAWNTVRNKYVGITLGPTDFSRTSIVSIFPLLAELSVTN